MYFSKGNLCQLFLVESECNRMLLLDGVLYTTSMNDENFPKGFLIPH